MDARTSGDDVIDRVVVGVDERPPAIHALDWVARAFAPTATIHAVNAVSPAVELAVAVVQIDSTTMVERSRHDLDQLWTSSARSTGAEVVCHVVEDSEARALMRIADETDSDMIVLGTKGHAHRVPRTLGGTVRDLLAHARHPLVIVPEGVDLELSGAVVVGVSDTERIGPALRWAADFAAARGMSLSLVRAGPRRRLFSLDGLIERMGYSIDREVVRAWALEDLADLAEQVRLATDDELSITWSVPDDKRHPRIVEPGGNAALLVLEARDHERVDAGSWIHDRIKHAPCPVVVFGTPLDPLVGLPPVPG